MKVDIEKIDFKENVGLPNTLPSDKYGHKFSQSVHRCEIVNDEVYDGDWLAWSEHEHSLFAFHSALFASSVKTSLAQDLSQN